MTPQTPLYQALTAVPCPNCQAPTGEPCTQPTDTGRRVVSWVHNARRDAAAEARHG